MKTTPHLYLVKGSGSPKFNAKAMLKRKLEAPPMEPWTRPKEVQELFDLIPQAKPKPELVAINAKLDTILQRLKEVLK